MNQVRCIGCHGLFPDIQGPTHRYMESSPGCWAAYGEALAREYSDPAFAVAHRLGVDAYAVQHPGRPSPQSIQSVAGHLVRLCLFLKHGLNDSRANAAILAATRTKSKFVWLTPPANRGEITVADVHGAATAENHARLVRAWAESAWSAWKPHHAQIETWLPAKFVRQ
jgi:Family of unknown function (DUF5946)